MALRGSGNEFPATLRQAIGGRQARCSAPHARLPLRFWVQALSGLPGRRSVQTIYSSVGLFRAPTPGRKLLLGPEWPWALRTLPTWSTLQDRR